MRTLPALALVLAFACRSSPEPAAEQGQRPAAQADAAPSCGEPGLTALQGVVERQGDGYVLVEQAGGRPIPLWEISRQEAVAPRSPDLSAWVGQRVVVCGDYDGAALYQARLQPGRP